MSRNVTDDTAIVRGGAVAVTTREVHDMTTKTATHTPGPWTAACNDIIATANDGRAFVGRIAGRRIASENDANARLIAAAPDLLTACKAALPSLEHHVPWHSILLAAIAKAEGTA